MDLNFVVLIGRLAQNAEISTTKNGNAVCSFTLELVKKNGDTETVAIQYYGKDTDRISPYMTKGRQVSVQGYLKTESWNYNGKQYSKLVLAVNDLEVLGFKADDRGEPKEGPYKEEVAGPEAFDDSDIPF